jgi:protoheme ferro-lyase
MQGVLKLSKRNLFLICSIVAFALLISQVNMAQSVILIEDSVDDVQKFVDGTFSVKGNFTNEVDIVSLTFAGTTLTLTLQSAPIINDQNHLYEVLLIWDNSSSYQNKTEITVGSLNGGIVIDFINHTVVNGTGGTCSSQPAAIYNTTLVQDNQLIWEMNVCLFEDMGNPVYVNASAQHSTTEGTSDVLYVDTYLTGEGPVTPPPGIIFDFNTILSILGTLLVSGFAGYTLGSISVYFFTTNIRSKQNNTIFMAVFVLALAVLVNVWFWITPWQILWNIAVLFLAVTFGYMWATRGIINLKFDSPLPENLPIDTDEDRSALIILSKGEAEEYNPLALVRKYHKQAETGVSQKRKLAQPIEFFKVKRKYRHIIKSQSELTIEDIKVNEPKNPYRKIAREIAEKLESSFLTFNMYQEAFINDWPTMNQALLSMISRGANKITILNLFMAESFEYEMALEEMKRIDYSEIGITISQTEFLANSDAIQDIIAKKIKATLPTNQDLSAVGILLVAEGQPEEWDSLYPLTEQEDIFRKGIAKKLTKQGFSEEKIKSAWIQDRIPTIEDGYQELKSKGCKIIVHVAATTPIDCVDSLYDIPKSLENQAKADNIELIPINAWNDDADIISTYLNLVTNAKEMPLAELGEGAEIVLQSTKVGATLAGQEEDSTDDEEESVE